VTETADNGWEDSLGGVITSESSSRTDSFLDKFRQVQTNSDKFRQVQTSLLIIKYTYLVTGTANNGWEDSPGGVITSESSFAHAGAIVNNQSGGIFVTHVGFSLKICLNLDRTRD
jgi:hypothetical protein